MHYALCMMLFSHSVRRLHFLRQSHRLGFADMHLVSAFLFCDDRRSNFFRVLPNSHRSHKFQNIVAYF